MCAVMLMSFLDDLHCLPAVGAKEEMDHMVVHLRLTSQVRVNHLADWC